MKRKFIITAIVLDDATSEDTPEDSAKAFKEFILDQLGYLTYDVKEFEVTCENV